MMFAICTTAVVFLLAGFALAEPARKHDYERHATKR